MDRNDLLGLHSGIADVIVDDKRIGECIYDLEIIVNLTGKIEAQGIIDEVTDGTIDFENKDVEFVLSGVLSREDIAYSAEFNCTISPVTYPKFIVNDIDQLFKSLSPINIEEEVEIEETESKAKA